MPADHPLARNEVVTVDDLVGEPIFASAQGWEGDLASWAGERRAELTLEGTFGLSYNASIFAREELGVLLTFDRLIDTSQQSGLTFLPLSPRLESGLYLAWGRRQLLTPMSMMFLSQVKDERRLSK